MGEWLLACLAVQSSFPDSDTFSITFDNLIFLKKKKEYASIPKCLIHFSFTLGNL